MPLRILLVSLVLWFVAALGLTLTGTLAALHPPAPQVLLLVLTALLLAFLLIPASSRRFVRIIPVRFLVSLHLIRLFAGTVFLLYYAAGLLPARFALPSGIGDILVALLAVPLLLSGSSTSRSRRIVYSLWNILGLADILMVIANAAVSALKDPASMSPLLQFPLGLLPTFIVPLIVTSHILLFALLISQESPTQKATPQ